MSAEAGPGPSSMASSPVVPGAAKQLRVKKRVINIVNPADPDSFSVDHVSFNHDQDDEVEVTRRVVREVTPIREMSPHTPTIGTPAGSDFAKRGILRSSGTPGSGNGVRFFPKNRFRIITPNHSLHPASPAPQATGTPERRRQSLLTQLLAVAMPSVSPEKPIAEDGNANESWEVPGQEGEISLVASSNNSMQINDEDDEGEDEDYVEEVTQPWDGTPEIHSSPLGLPVEGNCDSRDISQHELDPEPPSNDWGIAVPDDMSNLLHEKWSPTEPSFSISDPPPSTSSTATAMPRPTRQTSRSPLAQSQQSGTPGSRNLLLTPDDSQTTDVGATVRKRSTPPKQIDDLVPLEPSTPTPVIRPSTSVFAEMSAEQADLSWPLRRSTVDHGGVDDETAFQSAIFGQLDSSPLSDLPRSAAQTPITPRTGEKTAYFDCSDSSFAFSPLSIQPSPTPASSAMVTHDPAHELIGPTRDLFAAQTAHSDALAEEVKLYRDLASKLHNEVIERDTALAEMNGRLLESEVLKCQVDDLRKEVQDMKDGPDVALAKSKAHSAGATSTRTRPLGNDAADRTTVIQAETRDLEIRLSKALAEQVALERQMSEMRTARQEDQGRLKEAKQALVDAEDRHRDQLIASRQSPPPQPMPPNAGDTSRLEALQDRCTDLEIELTRAMDQRTTIQAQMADMREVKLADEEEIARLNVAVEGMRQSRRDGESMKARLEDVERRLEGESRRREEMEQRVQDERDARRRLEVENKELLRSLHATRAELAHTPTTTQDPALLTEISRLRSESASKDLEIVTLQRRKTELKEDREMLNIALDSKQQELELIKRKYGIKGRTSAIGPGTTPLGLSNRINENTPAPPMLNANTPAPGKHQHRSARRSSALGVHEFITPSLVNGDKRALRSAALLSSTSVPTRAIGQENGGSIRRERMLA